MDELGETFSGILEGVWMLLLLFPSPHILIGERSVVYSRSVATPGVEWGLSGHW